MGLFDIFKKQPTAKKTVYRGDLMIISGLAKKFQDKEEIKLGKTTLNKEEKDELLKTANDLTGKIVLANDLLEFQKRKLESNPKIFLFPFLELEDRRFDALYADGVLYEVILFKGDSQVGTITGEESLKALSKRFEKHISPEQLK